MPGYQWHGRSELSILAEDGPSGLTKKGTPRKFRPVAVCGTPGGYAKHIRERTVPCAACREDHARRERERRHTKGLSKPRPESRHGTISGATTHKKNREPMCDACRAVWNAYCTERRRNAERRERHRQYMRNYRAYLRERSAA